jgi:hypothetical protein
MGFFFFLSPLSLLELGPTRRWLLLKMNAAFRGRCRRDRPSLGAGGSFLAKAIFWLVLFIVDGGEKAFLKTGFFFGEGRLGV